MFIRINEKALNYAKAFMNIHFSKKKPTLKLVFQLLALQNFFFKKRSFPIILSSSGLSIEQIQPVIKKLIYRFALPKSIEKLLTWVISKKNSPLLKDLIKALLEIMYKDLNITHCEITTSKPLTVNQKNNLEKFFEKKLSKKIITEYFVDQTLISGILVRSNSFIWELSIKNRINFMLSKIFPEVNCDW